MCRICLAMSHRVVLAYCLIFILQVSSENGKTLLISNYAKVARSGTQIENEGRSSISGQKLWTQRSDAHVTRKQNVVHVYPQHPVYITPKRISDSTGNDDTIPGKGEVLIEDRFIQSRPFVNYDSKKPDLSYLPPKNPPQEVDSSLNTPPVLLPPLDNPGFNNSENSQVSYDSPYDSYNPPNSASSYSYNTPSNYPPYLDYDPSKGPPKIKGDSEETLHSPFPPYMDMDSAKNAPKMTDKPKDSSYSYNKPNLTPNFPSYLDYDPSKSPPMDKMTPPPYLEYNPYEHNHKGKPDESGMPTNHEDNHKEKEEGSHDSSEHHMGQKLPEYIDYDPYEVKQPQSKPDAPEMSVDKPAHDFPAYLYNHGDKLPPYLEYNPHEHHESGPPITQTFSGPSGDFAHNLPFLDHDHSHHFPEYLHYPQIYHEVKHATTTPEPEKERVNKKPYTYYYIGRKLWYIPLYFSVYFIVYIFVLVLKSIARHKISFNHYFEQDRGMKEVRNENMVDVTEHVLTGIDQATEKYD